MVLVCPTDTTQSQNRNFARTDSLPPAFLLSVNLSQRRTITCMFADTIKINRNGCPASLCFCRPRTTLEISEYRVSWPTERILEERYEWNCRTRAPLKITTRRVLQRATTLKHTHRRTLVSRGTFLVG